MIFKKVLVDCVKLKVKYVCDLIDYICDLVKINLYEKVVYIGVCVFFCDDYVGQ